MKHISTFLLSIVAGLTMLASIQAQSWDLKQKLGSSDQAPADNLGISVAISDSFMIAGAWWEEGEDGTNAPINSAGSAYIYRLGTNGEWTEVQKLVSPDREA
ncbi:MAG TPA: FG-GAP repeat protein, partial [Saprospiraceae bacterium]|nr:FG-GAP repeat protein [Saprospiraceae bacterium]